MNGNENPVVRENGEALYSDVHDGLLRVSFIAAFCLYLASHVEHVFVAAVMHSLLLLGASASAIGAALRAQHPLSPVLTRWDEALMLILLSLVMFKMVDGEAVQNALIALEQARPS